MSRSVESIPENIEFKKGVSSGYAAVISHETTVTPKEARTRYKKIRTKKNLSADFSAGVAAGISAAERQLNSEY